MSTTKRQGSHYIVPAIGEFDVKTTSSKAIAIREGQKRHDAHPESTIVIMTSRGFETHRFEAVVPPVVEEPTVEPVTVAEEPVTEVVEETTETEDEKPKREKGWNLGKTVWTPPPGYAKRGFVRRPPEDIESPVPGWDVLYNRPRKNRMTLRHSQRTEFALYCTLHDFLRPLNNQKESCTVIRDPWCPECTKAHEEG